MRLHSQTHTRTHFRVKVCSYSQHPGFLFGVSVRRERRTKDRVRGRRNGALRRRYIAPREQRMRSFRESGHRHSAWIVHARTKGENYPSRFLWWTMTTIDDQFYLFLGYFFRSFNFSSSSFLSLPLFLFARVNCSSGSHSNVLIFLHLLLFPFYASRYLHRDILRRYLRCNDYRFVILLRSVLSEDNDYYRKTVTED